MHRLTGVALVAVAAVAASFTAVPPASGIESAAAGSQSDARPVAVEYRPPVDAPVIDPFRPPATPYGPGNRGIDYATVPGAPVGAAAAGQVVFAGRVGTGLHVVVLHGDGLRTSSSFLASIAVHRGQAVAAGETLGTTTGPLHFGARAGDAYLDPMVLFGGGGGRAVVHLVPDAERSMGSEADERNGLRRLLGGLSSAAVAVGGTAVGWAREGVVAAGTGARSSVAELRAWAEAIAPLGSSPVFPVVSGARDWWQRRRECTPAGVGPPPAAGRRRVVLVAGLGSTSSPTAGIDGVDTATLGYAPDDVSRFSYRGGTTADTSYGAADTQVDIRESGRRLRELLEQLAAADPGLPIDVIAHSQGGLVARSALGPRPPPGVENLITLATPHHGADLATALDLTRRTVKGAAIQEALSHSGLSDIDPTSESVGQLSELSGFLRQLNDQPLPAGVRVTSIAARADAVVPAPRTHLAGATNVVVTVKGLNEHPLVPAAPAATREMALALAGMAPTCEALADAVVDVVVGSAISAAEDTAGLVLWATAG